MLPVESAIDVGGIYILVLILSLLLCLCYVYIFDVCFSNHRVIDAHEKGQT